MSLQDKPEVSLSAEALQHGYKWTAEYLGIDEQQEITLSLQTLLGSCSTDTQNLAEVQQIFCCIATAASHAEELADVPAPCSDHP